MQNNLCFTRTDNSHESGSMTIFVAAIILPLIFFFFTLTIDLQTYRTQSTLAQSVLDDASLYGYKFLPDINKAKANSLDYINSHSNFMANGLTSAFVENNFLVLTHKQNIPLYFSRVLSYFTEQDFSLEISALSVVRTTPFDVVVAVDRSSYLSPDFTANDFWSGSGYSLPSNYFSNHSSLGPEGTFFDARSITQQCFNPVFSSLKLAAIKAFKQFSSFTQNQVSIMFFPGSFTDSSVVKEFSMGGKQKDIPEGSFIETRQFVTSDKCPEGSLSRQQDTCLSPNESSEDTFVSNEACAAAALHASIETNEPLYRFPDYLALTQNPNPSPIVVEASDSPIYNKSHDKDLLASEVIWSRAAHRGLHRLGYTNTPQVLESILFKSLSSTTPASRGGLRNAAIKTVIILAGDVPVIGDQRFSGFNESDPVSQSLKQTFDRFSAIIRETNSKAISAGNALVKFNLFYIVPEGEYTRLDNDSLRIRNLQSFFESRSKDINLNFPPFFQATVLHGSPSAIMDKLISYSILSKKTGVIAQ